MPPRVTAHLDVESQGRFDLELQETVIGRQKTCHIVFDDPEISRNHAKITRDDGAHFIVDLESQLGTFVNGNPVQAAVRLEAGDIVQISGHALVYQVTTSPESSSAAAVDQDQVAVVMSTVDATQPVDLRSEVRPEAKLRALLEITRRLQEAPSMHELLPSILDGIFRIFPIAQRGFILLLDGDGRLVPAATRSRDHVDDDRPQISNTIIERALSDKQAILSQDARADEEFQQAQSVAFHRIRSMLCAPLMGKDQQPLGILQVHSPQEGASFSKEDLDVLVSVASATAMAVENVQMHETRIAQERILRDAFLAREVQRRFLPTTLPRIDRHSFYRYYDSAQSVGGDFYTFVELPRDRLAVAVGDVSGKGMPAAILMAKFSSDVRYAVLTQDDPADALQFLNRALAEAELEDKFITLALMVLDLPKNQLRVANAGHPHPLLRQPDGSIREIGSSRAGLPLNVSMDPDYVYATTTLELLEGSCVLIYTDGVTEARGPDGDEFGTPRVTDVFEKGPSRAERAGAGIMEAVLQFTGGQALHDDTTLICFSRDS